MLSIKFFKKVHPHSICKVKYVVYDSNLCAKPLKKGTSARKVKVSAESCDLVDLLFKKRI